MRRRGTLSKKTRLGLGLKSARAAKVFDGMRERQRRVGGAG
jgi:hypothetical protein